MNGIVPCVGCEKTVDALYCSYTCMQDDENKVLESPITGKLYYVTEWVEMDDGRFVAHEKREIDWSDDTEGEEPRGDDE